VGTIQQTPTVFSAKKIKGVPAYKLPHKKQEVEVREFVIVGLEGVAESLFHPKVGLLG
jgi:tRNA U55 pseudouridine synthase TruB